MASTYHAGGDIGYGRYGNPTWEMFEAAVGALEGGVATSFASGMAATAAVLDLVPPGGVVVAQEQAYYGTLALLREHERAGRLQVRPVDLTDLGTARAAVDGADLVWAESPTNPLLRVVDVPAVMGAAREAGAIGVVDNTFATPVLARPLLSGAAVVVHSATKYLSGHSDLLLGAAVVEDPALAERLVAHRGKHGASAGGVRGLARAARPAHPARADAARPGQRGRRWRNGCPATRRWPGCTTPAPGRW